MDQMLLIAVLLLNVLISVWNCYAVGTAWKDTMTLGTKFDKVLCWSGVIQSGVGFSMPILIVLAYIAVAVLTGGEEPQLTLQEGKELLNGIFSLWYVAVIFPILGSGLAIWAHSIRVAYKRRDFSSIAVAGWNTVAQIHNTISAIDNLGGALGEVGKLFGEIGSSKGDSRGKNRYPNYCISDNCYSRRFYDSFFTCKIFCKEKGIKNGRVCYSVKI